MDEERLSKLPLKNAHRTMKYMHQANRVATARFGDGTAARDPMIIVTLAAAMMQLEAAEIMADALSAATQPIEDEV